jgi:betaine-homocysteine S-methyltransferase
MVTLAATQPGHTRDGYDYVEACRILADHGATIVGMNCDRGPVTMLPLVARIAEAVDCAVAAQPVPYRTDESSPTMQSLRTPGVDLGVNYIGICCGAGPHHVRAMAEALGRDVPAGKYSPAMELHPMFRDAIGSKDKKFIELWNA